MSQDEKLIEKVFAEIDRESELGFTLWKSIPSSSTARAIALLEAEKGTRWKNLHLAAVRDGVVTSLRPPGSGVVFSESVSEWTQAARSPWEQGSRLNEWELCSFVQRRETAKLLAKVRGRVDRVPNWARDVASYFAYVSDSEIDHALRWTPLPKAKLLDAVLSGLSQRGFDLSLFKKSKAENTIALGGRRVTLESEYVNGTMRYLVNSLFPTGVGFTVYEGLLMIGIGEWDRLGSDNLSELPAVFGDVMTRLFELFDCRGPS